MEKTEKLSPLEKLEIVKQRISGTSASELSRRHGIARDTIKEWIDQLPERADLMFEHSATLRVMREKLADYDRLQRENDLLHIELEQLRGR